MANSDPWHGVKKEGGGLGYMLSRPINRPASTTDTPPSGNMKTPLDGMSGEALAVTGNSTTPAGVADALAGRIALPRPSVAAANGESSDEEDDEVVTEEDEDDYDDVYESYYNLAGFGRTKHVKPSSGRRGRTKKEKIMTRPTRGEEHSTYIAGNA